MCDFPLVSTILPGTVKERGSLKKKKKEELKKKTTQTHTHTTNSQVQRADWWLPEVWVWCVCFHTPWLKAVKRYRRCKARAIREGSPGVQCTE